MIPTTSTASTPSRSVTINASNMRHPPRSRRRGQAVGHSLLRAAVAEPGDLQRVPGRHEAVRPADLRLERDDPRADEFHHPAAPRAYQMIVLLPRVHVLVEEPAAPQAGLARQAALHQEVQVPVDRGARDLEP